MSKEAHEVYTSPDDERRDEVTSMSGWKHQMACS